MNDLSKNELIAICKEKGVRQSRITNLSMKSTHTLILQSCPPY
jgi:hypothetical protein